MTRLQIDHDADGAFVRITRDGEAAEIIPITYREVVRLMMQAAEVVLYDGAARGKQRQRGEDAPPSFIGTMGE